MGRLLLCLMLCVLVGPDRPPRKGRADKAGKPAATAKVEIDAKDAIPTSERFAELAKSDAIACLKASIARSRQEVKGFTTTLVKQERIGKRLNAEETLTASYRKEPHSVLLEWQINPPGLADKVLYVEGANDNQMLARPSSPLARKITGPFVSRDPEGRDAKQTARVSIREFGLQKAAERTYLAWEKAQKEGTLKVDYEGLKELEELGNRKCYVLKRTIDPPDEEGLGEVRVGLDAETWLQVFSVLKDPKGQKVGSYYFRDVKLNPEFEPGTFDKSALLK